ncbi:MAG: hypothetical protein IPK15_20390 [Verrucomicrobia bacterium]|nr:hypothetical protein [Verrucomicrobiota bacterium]
MKRCKSGLVWLATASVLVGGGENLSADTKANPYEAIVERNPFGLKPPPPPAPPEDPSTKVPPAPPATVEVTGITSILSSKRALLEIIPGPGKPMIKPILSEGERVDSIEVISINVEKNEVVVKNGGVVTNLTFKIAKSTPGPSAPGVVPPPVAPGSFPPPAQTTYNNNYGTGGRGVMMGGGAPAMAPAASAPGVNPAGTAGVPGADGFRSIPSRNIRGGQQANVPLSAEESVLQVEQNRILNQQISQNTGIRLPPLPPTVLNPNPEIPAGGVDDGGQGFQNPQAPATPTGNRRWVPRQINLPPPPGFPQQ